MARRRRFANADGRNAALLAAAFLAGSFVLPAHGDEVRLSEDGVIRGQVITYPRDRQVVVRSLTGTVYTLDWANTAGTTKRRDIVDEYLTRDRAAERSGRVADRMQLADWCRENRLESRRREQLQRLLELDPEHVAARVELGHVWQDGRWMTPDEQQRAKGLVLYNGKWVTPAVRQLLLQNADEQARSRDWYRRTKRWLAAIDGRDGRLKAKALREIASIDDEAALATLRRNFATHDRVDVRRHTIIALENIGGDRAAAVLATMAVEDAEDALRVEAVEAIERESVPFATGQIAKQLLSNSNDSVRRAAAALHWLGDETVVPKLIPALVTKHAIVVEVPIPAQRFGVGGGSIGPAQPIIHPAEMIARAGGPAPIYEPSRQPTRRQRVRVERKNREVLQALQKLTGQDFGFNERLWWTWLQSVRQG